MNKKRYFHTIRETIILTTACLTLAALMSSCGGSGASAQTPATASSPVASLSPGSLSFGTVALNGSGSQTVKVANTGTASLTVSQATVTGTGFSISGLSLPLTLDAGKSASFTVTFAPAAEGSAEGSISVASNAADSPASMALSGTGATVLVAVTPTTVNFGNVTVNSGTSQSVTLQNIGTASVTLSQVTSTGTGFNTSGLSAPITLAPGKSTSVAATFVPTAPGTATGSLTVVSNASNPTLAVPLAGTGTASDTSGILVTPSTATLQAGAVQTFTASVSGTNGGKLQWTVNGNVGGNSIWGTISTDGVYTAPRIDPGMAVTVSAVSASDSSMTGSAVVTVTNPATPELSGATYAQALRSWEAVMLPWIQDLAGLTWDANSRTWNSAPNWTAPAVGIGPQVYYLEQALRPATHMAIMKQDVSLMEELAEFHMAMLQQRTTTIGEMVQNAPSNAIIFIDGPSTARTFPWYEPYSSTQTRVRECQQCNAQYLSTAARLVRAIAEMPAANRTAPLNTFAQNFGNFLVSEQLLRLLYGTTPWSYYDNPDIPQPVVQAWKFLAETGYEPPHPIKYQAAMTDMELWMVSDAAEAMGADAAAPELAILTDDTRAQLQQAVLAGVNLMQVRCHHTVSPDGADVLSAFAGDYDDHPDYAYTGATGQDMPTTQDPKYGVSWDIEHSYRLPIIFRSLYETRSATGATFPALYDLVSLANSYVHLAFNGDSQLPDFNNFLDGWNGWFRVGYSSIPSGYPPHQYCDATGSPDNCLTPGTLQGWGQLAFANPDLASLYQNLVDLAYDDSADTAAFKDQHYYYQGHYSANGDLYPWLMIYVVGDSAERLP